MGAIEVANRWEGGPIRTIRGRLEQVLKIEIDITGPIVPWGRSALLLVDEPVQRRVRRSLAIPRHHRKAILHRRCRRSTHRRIYTTWTCAAPLEFPEGQGIDWTSMGHDGSLADAYRGQLCRNTVPLRDAGRVTSCLEDTRMRADRGACGRTMIQSRQQQGRRRMRGKPVRVQRRR